MKTKFWRLSSVQLKGSETYEGKDDSILVVTPKKFILIKSEDEYGTMKINTVTLTRERAKK